MPVVSPMATPHGGPVLLSTGVREGPYTPVSFTRGLGEVEVSFGFRKGSPHQDLRNGFLTVVGRAW